MVFPNLDLCLCKLIKFLSNFLPVKVNFEIEQWYNFFFLPCQDDFYKWSPLSMAAILSKKGSKPVNHTKEKLEQDHYKILNVVVVVLYVPI